MGSHLVAACWGGRSAGQTAARSSSGWPSRSVPSTCWLWLKYLSSSPSSTRCLRTETQQKDGTGIRVPAGSRWPRCRRRAQRRWRQICWTDTKDKWERSKCEPLKCSKATPQKTQRHVSISHLLWYYTASNGMWTHLIKLMVKKKKKGETCEWKRNFERSGTDGEC